MTDDIYHFGVKGMKWGVRRSEAELRSSRSKAEKYHDKLTSKDEKWAQKKLAKGKAEKALEKHEKRQTPKNLAKYERGVDLRTKKFDSMVQKEIAKDPNFKKNLSPQDRLYLEKRAANRVYASEFATKWGTEVVVNRAVKSGTKRYKNSRPDSNPKLVKVGAYVSGKVITSYLSKTNKDNMKAISYTKRFERDQRRADILTKELKKSKPLR